MTNNPPKNRSNFTVSALLALADLLVIWLSVVLLMMAIDMHPFAISGRITLVLATVAYIPAFMYIRHESNARRIQMLDRVFITSMKAVVVHALVFMSLSAFLHTDYSITFYCVFYAILFVLFPLVNMVCRYAFKNMRRRGRYRTRVAIVGTNTTSTRLAASMLKDAGYGYHIVGHFDSECLPEFKGNYVGDYTKLREMAEAHEIDEIYFTLVGEKAENMPRVVKIADDNMVEFYYVPKISRYVNGGFQLHNIGTMPVLTLRRNPLSIAWKRWSKRTFDVAFSSLFLIVSPIIFIPVAIGIKLSSPGPVFFRQDRTGYMGKSFKCFKFRTMRVNKDADRAQATADDPRKTRFGDFLRRTSLDELPQFINVWLGDMSVVGPRPHMLKHTEDYTSLVDKYMVRHVVKPGITGWAQVNGYRGITDQLWKMEKRVEYDVWYIENWTFSLDLKIVVRTIMNAVKGDKNAF